MKLFEGVNAQQASEQEAQKIAEQKLTMPSEETKAEGLARHLASSDMPGLENYKDQIDQLIPRTADAIQKTASSPVALIDMMSRALAETDKQYNTLATENANFHLGTMQNFQNLLTRKAGMDLNIQDANVATNKEAIMQRAQGSKDMIQSVENAGGALLDTYAMMKKLGYEKDYLNSLKFGTGADTTTPTDQVDPWSFTKKDQKPTATASFNPFDTNASMDDSLMKKLRPTTPLFADFTDSLI